MILKHYSNEHKLTPTTVVLTLYEQFKVYFRNEHASYLKLTINVRMPPPQSKIRNSNYYFKIFFLLIRNYIVRKRNQNLNRIRRFLGEQFPGYQR